MARRARTPARRGQLAGTGRHQRARHRRAAPRRGTARTPCRGTRGARALRGHRRRRAHRRVPTGRAPATGHRRTARRHRLHAADGPCPPAPPPRRRRPDRGSGRGRPHPAGGRGRAAARVLRGVRLPRPGVPAPRDGRGPGPRPARLRGRARRVRGGTAPPSPGRRSAADDLLARAVLGHGRQSDRPLRGRVGHRLPVAVAGRGTGPRPRAQPRRRHRRLRGGQPVPGGGHGVRGGPGTSARLPARRHHARRGRRRRGDRRGRPRRDPRRTGPRGGQLAAQPRALRSGPPRRGCGGGADRGRDRRQDPARGRPRPLPPDRHRGRGTRHRRRTLEPTSAGHPLDLRPHGVRAVRGAGGGPALLGGARPRHRPLRRRRGHAAGLARHPGAGGGSRPHRERARPAAPGLRRARRAHEPPAPRGRQVVPPALRRGRRRPVEHRHRGGLDRLALLAPAARSASRLPLRGQGVRALGTRGPPPCRSRPEGSRETPGRRRGGRRGGVLARAGHRRPHGRGRLLRAGGDSLIATRAVALLTEQLGPRAELTVRTLFGTRTVGALAARLRETAGTSA